MYNDRSIQEKEKYNDSNPLRVLHVTGILDRGGTESMIMNLYRNIDRTKIQFDFVENTYDNGYFENEIADLGGRIWHCPRLSGNNLIEYVKWWNSFFNKYKNEYIFVHGHIGSCAAVYLSIAKQYGLRTIAHCHSSLSSEMLKKYIFKILSLPLHFTADYFFACSTEAGRNRYGTRSEIKIFNNSVDTKKYTFDSEIRKKIRKEFGFSINTNVYGHVGRFHKSKNHEFLIHVFRHILADNPNSVLLLAGDGPLKDEIERKAKEFGVFDHIMFLGARDDIPELLQCMDLLIFPSIYEGLPVTLIEAQAIGLRSLISDVIPDESVITDDLIKKLSLKESPEVWASYAKSLLEYDRYSHDKEVTAAGFDIQKNSQWLQNFYLSGGQYE